MPTTEILHKVPCEIECECITIVGYKYSNSLLAIDNP